MRIFIKIYFFFQGKSLDYQESDIPDLLKRYNITNLPQILMFEKKN
jgi:hypothetical protein